MSKRKRKKVKNRLSQNKQYEIFCQGEKDFLNEKKLRDNPYKGQGPHSILYINWLGGWAAAFFQYVGSK